MATLLHFVLGGSASRCSDGGIARRCLSAAQRERLKKQLRDKTWFSQFCLASGICLSLFPVAAAISSRFVYSVDGSGNSHSLDTRGQAGGSLLRLVPGNHYPQGDPSLQSPPLVGSSSLAQPSCCDVEKDFTAVYDIPTPLRLNQLNVAFGQLSLSHDLAHTGLNDTNLVPDRGCSPSFAYKRSANVQTPSYDPLNHPNQITAWLDMSFVYGSDNTVLEALRNPLEQHLLLESEPGFPPLGCNRRGAKISRSGLAEPGLVYCVGDVRGNENILLLSLHFIFFREHNRLAKLIRQRQPLWTVEEVFQHARALNIAQYQHIIFKEYLPAILGQEVYSTSELADSAPTPDTTSPYNVFAEFSQAMYRSQHAQISNVLPVIDASGNEEVFRLFQLFFNPGIIAAKGVESVVRGGLKHYATEISNSLPQDLTEMPPNLIPLPMKIDLHLGAKDCFRGRDHGLPDYATMFKQATKNDITDLEDITIQKEKQDVLLKHYPHIGSNGGATLPNFSGIDLFPAGLLEDNLAGSSFGATFSYIIIQQLLRTRASDSKWYEHLCSAGNVPHTFSQEECRAIFSTTLSHLIVRNSRIQCAQRESFKVLEAASGLLCKSDLTSALDSAHVTSFSEAQFCPSYNCNKPAGSFDSAVTAPLSNSTSAQCSRSSQGSSTISTAVADTLSYGNGLLFAVVAMTAVCLMLLVIFLLWICVFAKRQREAQQAARMVHNERPQLRDFKTVDVSQTPPTGERRQQKRDAHEPRSHSDRHREWEHRAQRS